MRNAEDDGGFSPLLFDRLEASKGAAAGDGVRASIARELADLLNTRTPLAIDHLERRCRSAIDYGLPDLSAFPVGNHDAMARLTAHIRRAIAAYEPRLADPTVTIAPDARSGEALAVTVSGVIMVGQRRQAPVSFTLLLGDAVLGGHAG
ncbi:MAG: type VI secretion system baseplate subunit TssE [Acidibrevibacterium sp.]|uniref:type VI secretion system baseplate subunit TssE n=1 Tax=Acidibrevibacterium sp. TaxID=2606776 RepID=UPI003D02C34E